MQTRRRKTIYDWSVFGERGGPIRFFDKGNQRHRSVVHGYANPDIQDDFALHAIEYIEQVREWWGVRRESVVLCGVDGSTTAFAMAVLRLCPGIDDTYRFTSGRKAPTDENWDTDYSQSSLSLEGINPSECLFFVLDDDLVLGRALRSVCDCTPDVMGIYWVGLNLQIDVTDLYDGYGNDPDWLLKVNELRYLRTYGCDKNGAITGEEIYEYWKEWVHDEG